VNTATNWLLGLALCALLLLGPALDDIDYQTSLERDRDQAALALCRSELGPQARALWTTEGDLVCRVDAPMVAQGDGL